MSVHFNTTSHNLVFFCRKSSGINAAKKVRFTKTRSSPRLRAASSQPIEVVDLEDQPTLTSPVIVS